MVTKQMNSYFTTIAMVPYSNSSLRSSSSLRARGDTFQTSKNPPSSEMSSPLNSIDVSELISSLLLCTSCSNCSPSPSDSDKSAIIFYAYKSLSALISLNPLLPSPSLARACLRPEVWDNILGVLGRDSPVDVVTLACKCLFYLTER